MAVYTRSLIGTPNRTPARPAGRASSLPRLLASNEARLDRLQGHGIRVNGVAFLLAFFERVRVQPATRDNHLEWGHFIARILDELEPQTLDTTLRDQPQLGTRMI